MVYALEMPAAQTSEADAISIVPTKSLTYFMEAP
jgi:hypothetical protein